MRPGQGRRSSPPSTSSTRRWARFDDRAVPALDQAGRFCRRREASRGRLAGRNQRPGRRDPAAAAARRSLPTLPGHHARARARRLIRRAAPAVPAADLLGLVALMDTENNPIHGSTTLDDVNVNETVQPAATFGPPGIAASDDPLGL